MPAGEFVNSKARMEYNELTGKLEATFHQMRIRKPYRRNNNKAVPEQKFSIQFKADVVVRTDIAEINVTMQALSLPIVVISHCKQEADAALTIFWDNAFSSLVGFNVFIK